MSENAEIHLLDHKLRLLQVTDGFRSSMDSVLLGAACPAQEGETVLDMGCGVGGAGFCVLWRVAKSQLTGVEIQEDHVDLARANIALNAMDGRAEFVVSDIRNYKAQKRFDHVICNPPYLEAGTYTPSPLDKKAKALGHHDDISLLDWIDAGFHNVKAGGSLTIIHRADMVTKIIQGFGKRFGAVQIIPLWPHAGEEAKRVIVRAVKDRKSPSRLHSGIILHDSDGGYSKAAEAILREGAPIL